MMIFHHHLSCLKLLSMGDNPFNIFNPGFSSLSGLLKRGGSNGVVSEAVHVTMTLMDNNKRHHDIDG